MYIVHIGFYLAFSAASFWQPLPLFRAGLFRPLGRQTIAEFLLPVGRCRSALVCNDLKDIIGKLMPSKNLVSKVQNYDAHGYF